MRHTYTIFQVLPVFNYQLAAILCHKMCCFKILMVSRSSQTGRAAATKPDQASSQSSKRRVSVHSPYFRKIKCHELCNYVKVTVNSNRNSVMTLIQNRLVHQVNLADNGFTLLSTRWLNLPTGTLQKYCRNAR